MTTRVEKDDFSWSFEGYVEVPIEFSLNLGFLISETFPDNFSWNIVHVARRDSAYYMQLVKSVAAKG